MRNGILFTGAALILSGFLSGCVVHDGNPNAEPAWWPAFVIRESTEPHLMNYTSPGPGDLAIGEPARPSDPSSPFGHDGDSKD